PTEPRRPCPARRYRYAVSQADTNVPKCGKSRSPEAEWSGGEMGKTLAEKEWDSHLVRQGEGAEPDLLYIDLHLVHEVTSPQAFDGLRLAGRPLRRPDR